MSERERGSVETDHGELLLRVFTHEQAASSTFKLWFRFLNSFFSYIYFILLMFKINLILLKQVEQRNARCVTISHLSLTAVIIFIINNFHASF